MNTESFQRYLNDLRDMQQQMEDRVETTPEYNRIIRMMWAGKASGLNEAIRLGEIYLECE